MSNSERTSTRTISVVTPTLRRPEEVSALLENLSQQKVLPFEVILVDGTPAGENETEKIVQAVGPTLPFPVRYTRHGGGTAIQRNVGIDQSRGDFIAFIDDDVRLKPDFFGVILSVFEEDAEQRIGGIAGYITNEFLNPQTSPRWRWYRRLHLFGTYEPGRYDFKSGYPINRYLCPPHEGLRRLDFMGAGCAVWSRRVFEDGLRFSEFFKDYGVLEDAHLALRASRNWTLLECGRARCVHLRSQTGRIDKRRLARKTAINYRYVFVEIVPTRTLVQEMRFWSVQGFDLFRFFVRALRSRAREDWLAVLGKIEGIVAAFRVHSTLDDHLAEIRK